MKMMQMMQKGERSLQGNMVKRVGIGNSKSTLAIVGNNHTQTLHQRLAPFVEKSDTVLALRLPPGRFSPKNN